MASFMAKAKQVGFWIAWGLGCLLCFAFVCVWLVLAIPVYAIVTIGLAFVLPLTAIVDHPVVFLGITYAVVLFWFLGGVG